MFNIRIKQIATFLSVSLLIFLISYTYNNNMSKNDKVKRKIIRNILIWTHNNTPPISDFKYGRKSFIDLGCKINNCFVTNDRNYLPNITEWDAVLFHAPEFTWRYTKWKHGFPTSRSAEQIYIFASMESAANYPVCDKRFEDYFNWTMTYKLNSDIQWKYITVRDSKNRDIGPKEDMKWKDVNGNLTNELKAVLKRKTIAAAWFVSNCGSLSNRLEYAHDLQDELKDIGLSLDIYGQCGDLKCGLDNQQACSKKLSDDYHFYLSFENSFSEDYVTEKFLTAVQNDVVPIVYGGANYTRFAPNTSFINANLYSPLRLANLIKHLMENETDYEKYFRWRQEYSFISPMETYEAHPFCKLCKDLDEQRRTNNRRTYVDFRTWWNGEGDLTIGC